MNVVLDLLIKIYTTFYKFLTYTCNPWSVIGCAIALHEKYVDTAIIHHSCMHKKNNRFKSVI